jgi:hypothetical protein
MCTSTWTSAERISPSDRPRGRYPEEVTNYDRTGFFDYTAALKTGDPVVVTFKGIVDALERGGGAYAELNFEAGTANYIEPLLLSAIQV